jgi:circadian clock protein KaiC
MAEPNPADTSQIVPTGVEGLDEVLRGGLMRRRTYLLEGFPGSGKTTLALQFLLAGRDRGETGLFVTLSESREELSHSAASHGWDLEGLQVLEILAPEASLRGEARYTMYHPSEVELAETTKAVLSEAQRLRPALVVFDSLSELRLLAENPLRYRRQILALKQYFTEQQCTVIFLDDRSADQRDLELHSIAHGVLSLERRVPEYGVTRRQLQVVKLRGRAFREGLHDFCIARGGLRIFPRLIAAEHRKPYARETLSSDLPSLDTLLGGGLARGTSTLVVGAAGTGKSSLATQYAVAAGRRGERAALFMFDESLATFFERSEGLGMDLETLMHDDLLVLRQIDPAELTPGEFSQLLRREVQELGTRMVVIDSLNGYLNAMPSERFLALHLHELLTFLGQQGVNTLLLMTEHGLIGRNEGFPIDASYLADTVILLRYFEADGDVRQAVSVIKKRTGRHERSIRELRFEDGLKIGEPLRGMQGVLAGTPQFLDGHRTYEMTAPAAAARGDRNGPNGLHDRAPDR